MPLRSRRSAPAVRAISYCILAWCFLVVNSVHASSSSTSTTSTGPWTVTATQCQDKQPPNVTCPVNTTLYGQSPVLPNAVIYRIPVEDDCIGVHILSQVPKPGSHLPASSDPYNVTITVIDSSNKTGSCQWSVYVPPLATSEFVRAKVRSRNQATWMPSTTLPRRKARGGYLAGINVKTSSNGQLRHMPSQVLKFYAYSRSGGRSEVLRFRCNATSARTSRGKRLYLSHPVPFGADEDVTVRMIPPAPQAKSGDGASTTTTNVTASAVLRSAVQEVRIALLVQLLH
jgi:HYR domain